MGFYGDAVLPRIMNVAMGNRVLTAERQRALAGARGRVLEVGFGSGHNLPVYPGAVEQVVAVDPSRVAAKLARKRIAAAAIPVEYLPLHGERIDAPDASFDSVVCTFTLCTIPDPLAALGQMLRVLAPAGRFFFLEHGRADDARVRRWQDRLNGMQKALVGGCHLNRDIAGLVRAAGFQIEQLDQHYLERQPRILGYLTRGVARRPGGVTERA
jgi:ubiquinone/menaquinone biosynthesis C-methylase UbiE